MANYKPFKMKGHELPGPNQREASPLKQWWNPFNKEVKSERVDEKSYGGFGDDDDGPTSTEKKSRTYQNRFTGNRKVVTKTRTQSGGPGDISGTKDVKRKVVTKQKQHGKKDDQGYDTREHKNVSQKDVTKTTRKGSVWAPKKNVQKTKTKTTDYRKMSPAKKKSSPAKCPLVAALAPMAIKAVSGAMSKKKEE